MKLVKCKNRYLDETGKEVECGRILGALTDLQVDLLKLDTEGPIYRCPQCHPEQRWIRVKGSQEGITFEVMEEHPEFKEEIKFDKLIICQQVG